MVYVAKGSFWILLGKAVLLVISFIMMTAYARWLSKETYGTYQFVMAIVGIASILALSGTNVSLIRSIARNKEGTLIVVIKEKMKWSLLGSLGLIVFAGWNFFNHSIELAASFFVAALFLPLWTTTSLARVFWNAKKNFRFEFIYKVGPATFILFSILPVIYFTNRTFFLVLATFVFYAIFEGFFLYKTIKKLKNNECDEGAIKFGKNLTIMDIAVTIGRNLDSVIIWLLLGPAQVAIYSFSYFPIKAMSNTLPVQSLALPKISEKNISDIKKGLLRKFFFLFLIVLPFTIIVVVAVPFVYKIFFPSYMESARYLQVLSLIMLLIPFQLLETALVSEIRKKELYIIRVGSSLIKIFLLLILTPFLGIWGVVGATLIMQFLRNGAIFYYFKKI